jgi:Tat protein translocase TatC
MTAPNDNTDMPRMTLGEHLEELRKRILLALAGLAAGMIVSMALGTHIVDLLRLPYQYAMQSVGRDPELAVLKVGGAFNVWMSVSLYAGLALSSPWVFYQLWAFVAAGLYPRERRWVTAAVPFSAVLFIAGAAFAMLIAVPAIRFFVWFDGEMGVRPIITLPDYISFLMSLMLVMGLAFQTPLLVLILSRIGLVGPNGLRKYRRHVIVGIAAFAAVFAPADPMSMIAMMAPMWMLYELGVFMSHRLVFRKRLTQDLPDA